MNRAAAAAVHARWPLRTRAAGRRRAVDRCRKGGPWIAAGRVGRTESVPILEIAVKGLGADVRCGSCRLSV